MPGPIRYHLDEHVDPDVAEELRRRGIDVTTSVDAALLGADDLDHLTFAAAQSRVIVTHDSDFLRQNAIGVPHHGIVYAHQQSRSVGELIQFLEFLGCVVDSDQMLNRVEFA